MKKTYYELLVDYPGSYWPIGSILEWVEERQWYSVPIGTAREGHKLFAPIGIKSPSDYPDVFKRL